MSPRPFFFLGGGGRGWTTSAAAAREAPALRMATAGQPPGLGGMNGLWEGGGQRARPPHHGMELGTRVASSLLGLHRGHRESVK